jgi:hypothetical protein
MFEGTNMEKLIICSCNLLASFNVDCYLWFTYSCHMVCVTEMDVSIHSNFYNTRDTEMGFCWDVLKTSCFHTQYTGRMAWSSAGQHSLSVTPDTAQEGSPLWLIPLQAFSPSIIVSVTLLNSPECIQDHLKLPAGHLMVQMKPGPFNLPYLTLHHGMPITSLQNVNITHGAAPRSARTLCAQACAIITWTHLKCIWSGYDVLVDKDAHFQMMQTQFPEIR